MIVFIPDGLLITLTVRAYDRTALPVKSLYTPSIFDVPIIG
jgi:hypothetical protein